jgi:hypothetical protein
VPRNARILRELIDVAVRRTEVHRGITAFVLFSKENFNPVGPKLTGGCSDIVNKEACNWTRREVTIDVAVGSKDLHLATVRQLQYTEPRKVKFRSKAQDISKKVNSRLEILRTSTTQANLTIFTPSEYAHWLSMSTERTLPRCQTARRLQPHQQRSPRPCSTGSSTGDPHRGGRADRCAGTAGRAPTAHQGLPAGA